MVEEEIIEDFIGTDFSLIMHAVPFLLEEEQIDTSSSIIKPALQDNLLFEDIDLRSTFLPMPNIHGIVGRNGISEPTFQTYVHRTGYIGLGYNLERVLARNGINEKVISHSIKYYFPEIF